MLLLLVWAVLGASRFPGKRPWLAASVASAIVLLPITRECTLLEGAIVPMLFYTTLSSMQLAIGMVEQQAGRLRLGLLLLMATAMVKFEGMILLGLWVMVLMLDRESRAALWPLRRIGRAGAGPGRVAALCGVPLAQSAFLILYPAGKPVAEEHRRGVSHPADDLGGDGVAPVLKQ